MKITKTPTAVTPKYADNGSAGLDLYVDTKDEYEIWPGETCLLPTGIKVEIPRNYFGAIYPRSSLHKKGLTLANNVGIIDSSYRGEILLPIKNISENVIFINGEWGIRTPLVQLIIQPYKFEKVEVVDGELSSTERGANGFGSSDNGGIK
jgi:dUTP pyrophosphatase